MLEFSQGYLTLHELPVFPVCRAIDGSHCEHEVWHKGGRCTSPGKVPLVPWKEYQTRLPTEVEVRSWWRKWPTANIGMATGEVSGVCVVDLDGELAQREAQRLGYDEGPWVATGRIGGKHLYFRWRPDAPSIFAKREGIDFRGQGGFVLLPPSYHASGNAYKWGQAPQQGTPLPALPLWVNDLAGDRSEDGTKIEKAPLDLSVVLAGIPEGERDSTIWSYACKLRADNVPLGYAEVFVAQAARDCRPPFDEDLALEKVRRAYRDYEPTQRLVVTGGGIGKTFPAGYQWQTLAALLDSVPEDQPQIVDGILWGQRTTWVYSAPAAGKTMFTLAMLMHVAAGQPFCGREVTQGPVLLIEEDMPFSVLGEYVETLADIYGFDLATLPFWVNKEHGLRITDKEGMQAAIKAIEGAPTKPLVVVLDACERIVPSEKFSSKELDYLHMLLQYCHNHQVTPLIIDHTRKSGNGVGAQDGNPLDMLYGGRSKTGISDVMLYFSGSIKSRARVSFKKFRGPYPPDFDCSFDGSSGFEIKDQPRELSGNERKFMKVLNNSREEWTTTEELVKEMKASKQTILRTAGFLLKDRLIVQETLNRSDGGLVNAYKVNTGMTYVGFDQLDPS